MIFEQDQFDKNKDAHQQYDIRKSIEVNTPNKQNLNSCSNSFDAKNFESNNEELSSMFSNHIINFSPQMKEQKNNIILPSSPQRNQKGSKNFQSCLQNNNHYENSQKHKSSSFQKNIYDKVNDDGITEIDNKHQQDNQNQEKRYSLQFRRGSSPIAFEEHNQVVLRKAIKSLTRQGKSLKEEEQKQDIEQKEENDDKKQDSKFLFAANINDLLNLEQVNRIIKIHL